jgi:hypothetical protein
VSTGWAPPEVHPVSATARPTTEREIDRVRGQDGPLGAMVFK